MSLGIGSGLGSEQKGNLAPALDGVIYSNYIGRLPEDSCQHFNTNPESTAEEHGT